MQTFLLFIKVVKGGIEKTLAKFFAGSLRGDKKLK